uniref:Uncharacterized protein n=1 Tax=Anguilla anguilla TaxID=7936 RepID=A0A0E9T0S2_ANGAN
MRFIILIRTINHLARCWEASGLKVAL